MLLKMIELSFVETIQVGDDLSIAPRISSYCRRDDHISDRTVTMIPPNQNSEFHRYHLHDISRPSLSGMAHISLLKH